MPWKPADADDFPSLGWALLEWMGEYLPSPRDASQPLTFTDQQALEIVEWFRIDPITERLVYRRGYSRLAKGKGKSPVEAAKSIAEFVGPVRFDGWDAAGQPVGRPWGSKGDPRAWVQIGAISEDQTDNTWSVIHYFLTENDGKAADALGIDAGLTRCFLPSQPGAKMEPVTSAAGSREGQPITYGVLDESHLMTVSNGGVKLARTIRRNVAKMGGRSYETTNSFIIGAESVAETSYNAVRKGSPGIFAVEVEAPHEIDGVPVNEQAPDHILLAALKVAYGDSYWVDLQRIVADVRDPAMPWDDSARFFLNWNRNSGEGWGVIPRQIWAQRAGTAGVLTSSGVAALQVAPDQRSAAMSFAAPRADGNVQVEVSKHQAGTDWCVASCVKAYAETGQPVVVDANSPTSGILEAIRAAGVELYEMPLTEFAEACSAFQNASMHGGIVHLDEGSLNDALRGAETRRSGERWVWSQRSSDIDITSLVATTLAYGLARLPPAPPAYASAPAAQSSDNFFRPASRLNI